MSTSASTRRDAGLGVEATLTEKLLHENVSWANPVLIGREKTLMKVTFTEQGITVMHAELAANGERVHRLLLVRRIVASHISDQAHHLQLLKHLTAWRRNNGVEIGLKPGDR